MGSSPPAWLIFAVIIGLAVPGSAVFGLAAAWLWKRFAEPHIEDVPLASEGAASETRDNAA